MSLPLIPILSIIEKIADRAIPDPAEKAKLQLELAKLADAEAQRSHQEMLGQIETNKVEAQHRSIFIAGWRPFIGWGCGGALLYNTLVAPMAGLPVADLGFLQTVLLAMLGIGSMRSYEKVKGVANDTPLGKPAVPTPITTPAEPPKKKFKIPDITPW